MATTIPRTKDEKSNKLVTQRVATYGTIKPHAASRNTDSPSPWNMLVRRPIAVVSLVAVVLCLGYIGLRSHSGRPGNPWSLFPAPPRHRDDSIRVDTLPHKYLPGGPSDPSRRKRLIFVGDIHGCNKELRTLIKTVKLDSKHDHLIHTGDIVGKGPDGAGVIDTLLEHHASGVRGNWDEHVLSPPGTLGKGRKSRSVAAARADLKPHHMAYLASMPHILQIPALFPHHHGTRSSSNETDRPSGDEDSDDDEPRIAPPADSIRPDFKHLPRLGSPGAMAVAHAGLVPGVPARAQQPRDVTRMRWMDPRTLQTSDRNKSIGPLWTVLWNQYQRRVAAKDDEPEEGVDEKTVGVGGEEGKAEGAVGEEPVTAVYGHNSKDGVRVERWSVGLDGGCVRGGELVALIVDAKGGRELVRIPCRDYIA